MRKHYTLIVDHPNEGYIGKVRITDRAPMTAEKNEETTAHKRNLDTGEQYTEQIVGLGYHDFENEDDFRENDWNVTMEKLAEIDEEHLVNAGLDPADVFDRDEREAAA